jgi:type IV pilus assembly protein PilB
MPKKAPANNMTRKKLGDLVVEQGKVTPQELETALSYQRATGKPLGEVLILLGITTEAQLMEVLASQQSVESWDLKDNPPTSDALERVPMDLCLKHLLVPVKVSDSTLTVAMRDPGNLEVVDLMYATTRLRIEPVQASDAQLTAVLQELYGKDPLYRTSFEKFVSKALEDIKVDQPAEDHWLEVTEEETRPVIGIVTQIINEAADMRASDIHIEPTSGDAEVRYRIDGRLLRVRQIPGSLVRMVVARIKIMAELDIASHRLPQDGRVELREGLRSLDLRVSVLPTQYGSRIAIRLLDRSNALKTLDKLGFAENTVEVFRDIVTKPYGIVLVTGPTGSGKTTTLYAALNEVHDVGMNIMTCEDPIEYELKGVSQSQVNEKAGLTFATQLRAILRQDPDVILVGEIRDRETAETAVRAALTGHLVLSTLHCNDAANAIPRLIDMGVEPYLLSTSMIGIVAQRLLRVLCPTCKVQRDSTDSERRMLASLGFDNVHSLWSAVGCKKCNLSGYFGRIAVHEVLPVTEGIHELIAERATPDALRAAAEPYGFRPLHQDALDRVLTGETSLEEVRRMIFLDTFKQKKTQLLLAS